MRKALVLMIAIGLAAAGAWAQSDALLGPHNTNNTYGCQSCHAPHSQVMAGQGLYLWGLSVPNKTYSTYGGGSLTVTLASGVAPTDTSAHTVLCLSCHDQTFNPVMAGSCTGTLAANCVGQTSPTTNMTTTISTFTGSGDGTFTTINGGVVGSSGTDLSANHPIHVLYPNVAGAPTAGYTASTADTFWSLLATGTGLVTSTGSFTDTGTVFSYGHPARIFLDPSNNPYIECGSCHDPHSQTTAVVTVAGTPSTVGTAHFLRGEYDNTWTQAAFCMSCHADKSAAWKGTGLQ